MWLMSCLFTRTIRSLVKPFVFLAFLFRSISRYIRTGRTWGGDMWRFLGVRSRSTIRLLLMRLRSLVSMVRLLVVVVVVVTVEEVVGAVGIRLVETCRGLDRVMMGKRMLTIRVS
uniref:Uncharacterized protein n=1 Tax=Brassica campestris TaxID=3711 RepID=A0A3P5Z7V0_BRACM|nr:unnamed protein product [Brassica rapa]